MSTRSFIHVHRADGTWARIYCHFDSYWEGVGATLHKHYGTQEKAEALVALGDISALGEKHDFDFGSHLSEKHGYDYDRRANDPEYRRLSRMCNAYGRDREETGTEAVTGATLEDVFEPQEYIYVWRDEGWLTMKRSKDLSKLFPLADALASIATEDHGEVYEDSSQTADGDLDGLGDQSCKTEEPGGDIPVWRA